MVCYTWTYHSGIGILFTVISKLSPISMLSGRSLEQNPYKYLTDFALHRHTQTHSHLNVSSFLFLKSRTVFSYVFTASVSEIVFKLSHLFES